MQKHRLKTWTEFYSLVVHGLKPFEYRKNDRDFKRGDILVLCEWDQDQQLYTGQEHEYLVTLVITACPGLPDGYCIMAIRELGPEVKQEDECQASRS